MDNMIRQWHSIEKVWGLMEAFELRTGTKFDRIGLFRLDVLYEDSIRIIEGEVEETAVIPSLMARHLNPHATYNDRMFYGAREYAEIWATDRFGSVGEYMNWQTTAPYSVFKGLHSEEFLHYILYEKWKIPIFEKDICFKRVRAGGKVMDDCMLFMSPNTGVFVLGMHRSGTSLLSGLLSEFAGFSVDGELEGIRAINWDILKTRMLFDKTTFGWRSKGFPGPPLILFLPVTNRGKQ